MQLQTTNFRQTYLISSQMLFILVELRSLAFSNFLLASFSLCRLAVSCLQFLLWHCWHFEVCELHHVLWRTSGQGFLKLPSIKTNLSRMSSHKRPTRLVWPKDGTLGTQVTLAFNAHLFIDRSYVRVVVVAFALHVKILGDSLTNHFSPVLF